MITVDELTHLLFLDSVQGLIERIESEPDFTGKVSMLSVYDDFALIIYELDGYIASEKITLQNIGQSTPSELLGKLREQI